MSIIKTSSLALAATAIIIVAAGSANAMATKNNYTSPVSTVQSSLPDNNTATSTLSGKAFFDRIANQGG